MHSYTWNEQIESPGFIEKTLWSSHRLALKLKSSPSMAPVTPSHMAKSTLLMDWIAPHLIQVTLLTPLFSHPVAELTNLMVQATPQVTLELMWPVCQLKWHVWRTYWPLIAQVTPLLAQSDPSGSSSDPSGSSTDPSGSSTDPPGDSSDPYTG